MISRALVRKSLRKTTLLSLTALLAFGSTTSGITSAAADVEQLAPPAAQKAIQQLPTIDIPQTTESIDKVRRLEIEGEKNFDQNLVDKALTKWQEGYAMSIEMKYAEGEGRALTNMCRVYLDRGDWIKAKYLGENAIEVLGSGADKRALGRARVALAQAYFGLGQNEWAGTQLAEAIKTFTNEEAGDAAEAAKLLTLAGQLLIRYGKVREAVQFFQQSATYYLQANDSVGAVRAHINVSSILEQGGTVTAALEEAQKAVDIAGSLGKQNYQLTISALGALGNAQFCLGEYAKGKATYEQALITAQKMTSKEFTPAARANLDLGFGHCLLAVGDLDLAKAYIERALPVFKSLNASTAEAQAFNALGVLEEQQGNHSKATTHLMQALELQQLVRPPQVKLNIAVLQNLAFVEARNGSGRDARTHLLAALPFFISGKSKETPETLRLLEARTYAALGEIYYKLSDAQNADAALKKAITLGTAINDDASLWRDYVNLARLQLAQGDQGASKDSLNSALSFFRSPQAGAFASAERLAFVSSREDLGSTMVAMLARMGMNAEALLAAEQLKEESFSNDFSKRSGAVKPDDKDVYTDLANLRAHLHAAESYDPPSKITKEWQSWLQRFRTLISQNRPLARMIAPVPNRIADMVKAVQSEKATFVEFCVGPESTVVFTLDNTGRLSATVLPINKKQLQQQVTTLLSQGTAAGESGGASQNAAQKERSILQSLYSELFPAAVRPAMPKGPDQTVCIVPDGILFNVPFAALVDEQGKYFIESHTITLACSMGALLDIPARYSTDNSSILIASLAGENDPVAGVFPANEVTRLLGKDADIAEVREQSRGKSAIHFSSRMHLQANNPFSTILPLAPAKKVTAENLFGTSVLSDLAVWGASSVNAKDIQGTSVGVFSRGLNYAGIRNVVVGLWMPPEQARSSELQDFYRQKQAGLSQAQSLRKAELIAMSKDPAPHSWAAFQLVGPGY
ncbi:MAG TPA: CHAT domain-containing tetratricopeptide repeat protein [Oculatellaceae cyanobacterium]